MKNELRQDSIAKLPVLLKAWYSSTHQNSPFHSFLHLPCSQRAVQWPWTVYTASGLLNVCRTPLPRRLVLVGIPNKPLSDGIGWDILWHNGVMGKSSFLMGISSTSKKNGSNSQLKVAQLVSIHRLWPTPTTQSQHGIENARQEFQGFMLWAPFEGAVILLFEDASFVSRYILFIQHHWLQWDTLRLGSAKGKTRGC